MTDKPNMPETATEALKRALAAKKANTQSHADKAGGIAVERAVSAKNTAMAKPAFRKASKRG